MQRRPLLGPWSLVTAVLAACGDTGDRPDTPKPPPSPPPPPAAESAVGSAAHDAVVLEGAAAEVVSFLAGDADFDALSLADTVEFYLVPEAGGARARVSRRTLRDRYAWGVGEGAARHSFVPSGLLTKMTTRAGRHFNCRESTLASRVPSLAARPHVGVRLEPPDAQSCLDTWNATFVFDTAGGRPRLVAAVYDQWEW